MTSKSRNFHAFHIRKWYSFEEETLSTESGKLADGEPLIKIVVACAVHNPHAGKYVKNLDDTSEASRELGLEFGRRIHERLGGRKCESYGKAALVGVNGDYEHGNALLTTEFANPVREALGGALSWVPSTGKRGGPGTEIDIPFGHKDALYVRSHYDTVSITFGDGPSPDEVIIAMALATRGRLHARLGGITTKTMTGDNGLT